MIVRPVTGHNPKLKLPPGAVDAQMHMYLPGFPAQPGGPDLPAGALPDAAQYRSVMRWLGIDRVIITQGNAHQRDNSNLVACLAEMGPIARGVAAIAGEEPDSALDALAEAGVVGARIMDLPGGAVGLEALEAVDARASTRGWMVAVQFDGGNILEHEARLKKLKSRWVLDHHGKFFAGVDPDGPEIAALLKLIDRGNVWFKFAGVYESSRAGWPYADVAAFSRRIADHAPERIIWGSNWPHNMIRKTEDYPDDARLAELVLGWLANDRAKHLALVENPEHLFKLPAFAAA